MWAEAADLLSADGRYAVGRARVPWMRIAVVVVLSGAVYGGAMGALGWRERAVLYSAIKVPILLSTALVLCLPSSWVVHALLGLRDDFPAALRGILSAQGTLSIALLSLAPVTSFFYACGIAYGPALFLNGCAFLVALAAAQLTLARHYRPLIERNPRHKLALASWFALYAFTTIKVGWVLRPFVGDPALPVTFLREGRWADNPYVNLFWNVAGMAWTLLRVLVGQEP
jgi:hypothetical protein